MRLKSSYLQKISSADAGIDEPDIHVDESPPRRYSFAWDGIAAHWSSVVHDGSKTIRWGRSDGFHSDIAGLVHPWGPGNYASFS